jgi:DNA-binding MarR family transcriptional regulator
MKTLNLNDIVYVHLTPAGEKLWADYLNEFPYTKAHPDIDVFAREKNRHYAGDFRYGFSLWEDSWSSLRSSDHSATSVPHHSLKTTRSSSRSTPAG